MRTDIYWVRTRHTHTLVATHTHTHHIELHHKDNGGCTQRQTRERAEADKGASRGRQRQTRERAEADKGARRGRQGSAQRQTRERAARQTIAQR